MSSNTNQVVRPGISPEALARAGVRNVTTAEAKDLVGLAEAGAFIPYHGIDGQPVIDGGKPYGRLRLTDPPAGRGKYSQRYESKVHAFLPPGLADLKGGGDLVVVEGEFKSMSLVEAGVPAVGISGFYGAATGGEDSVMCPELVAVLERLKPKRILFLGDADTSTNFQFSIAAVRLAKMVGLPVALPRISYGDPGKGVDDVRDSKGDAFLGWWSHIVQQAIPVGDLTPAQLAFGLWDHDKDAIAELTGEAQAKSYKRALECANWMKRNEPLAAGKFEDMITASFGVKRAALGRAMRAEAKAKSAGEPKAVDREELNKLIEAAIRGVYFDGERYYRKEADGRYHRMCREDAKLHLKAENLDRFATEEESDEAETAALSPGEQALLDIQRKNRVLFAGPLCGRQPGAMEENGNLLLVTDGPKQVAAEPGGTPYILGFLETLLGKHAGDPHWKTQMDCLLGWLKHGRRAIENPGVHTPGLMLIIAGPVGCGKSLLQTVITSILGGRSADPSQWLQGRTPFNDACWGAEHLLMGDANLSDDWESKKVFRDKAKEVVASPLYSCHRKGRAEFSARPIWRMTLTCNDDPNSMQILPQLDESIADKVLLLKAYSPPIPWGEKDGGGGENLLSKLLNEVPALLALLQAWELPAELRKHRFGQTEWHHPALLELLEATSPDSELSEFLRDWLDSKPADVDGITTTQLLHELEKISGGRILRTIRNAMALGHCVRRLSADPKWRGRIERTKIRHGVDRVPTSAWKFTIGQQEQQEFKPVHTELYAV